MLALLCATSSQVQGKNYNILSIDGGALKGMIPAVVIEKMELYARKYANDNGYDIPVLTASKKDRVHMTQLFDMFAGASAGSLVTGMLSIPKKNTKNGEPMYWGDEFFDLLNENRDSLA